MDFFTSDYDAILGIAMTGLDLFSLCFLKGIAKLPFIDETRLLAAVAEVKCMLTVIN